MKIPLNFFIILVYFLTNQQIVLSTPSDFCTKEFVTCRVCSTQNNVINLELCVDISTCSEDSDTVNTFQESIDRLLGLNLNITSLTIRNTNMIHIPPTLCKLVYLQELDLSNNCITELPPACLTNLQAIKNIQLNNNRLEKLTDGTFDGLNNLETLTMENNQINYVGEGVFSNLNDLKNLKVLDMEKNSLTKVGPWIFIRAIYVSTSRINLKNNKISTFNNVMNWTFSCEEKPKENNIKFELELGNNLIQHLNDLLTPFFKSQMDLLCLFSKIKTDSASIRLRGNPFNCDCTDFEIISLAKFAKYSSVLNDNNCKKPIDLQDKKLLSLDLNELKCSLSDNCPVGCNCIEQPSTRYLFIKCTNSYTKEELPELLPSAIHKHLKYNYNLDFHGSNLKLLNTRDYLQTTSYLDLSNLNLTDISESFLKSIKNIDIILLHSNNLRSLPEKCTIIPFTFKEISLQNNPWNCDCSNQWFKEWLIDIEPRLKSPNSILCSSPSWLLGKNILKVNNEDFCSDPNENQLRRALAGALVPILGFLLLVFLLYLIVRKFKVAINAKFNLHPFDKDECEGEEMIYDVFISCSFQDRLDGMTLLRYLESKNYHVCYHERDFMAGSAIAENICEAILRSKRVVCLLTASFLKSTYCMFEFETALHKNIETKRRRLIMLLYDTVVVRRENLRPDLYDFLTSHTYIEVKDNKKWTDQLCYSLPLKKNTDNKIRTFEKCSNMIF